MYLWLNWLVFVFYICIITLQRTMIAPHCSSNRNSEPVTSLCMTSWPAWQLSFACSDLQIQIKRSMCEKYVVKGRKKSILETLGSLILKNHARSDTHFGPELYDKQNLDAMTIVHTVWKISALEDSMFAYNANRACNLGHRSYAGVVTGSWSLASHYTR